MKEEEVEVKECVGSFRRFASPCEFKFKSVVFIKFKL